MSFLVWLMMQIASHKDQLAVGPPRPVKAPVCRIPKGEIPKDIAPCPNPPCPVPKGQK